MATSLSVCSSSLEVAVCCRKWFDRLDLRSTSRTWRCPPVCFRFRLNGDGRCLFLPTLFPLIDTSLPWFSGVCTEVFCGEAEAAAAVGIALAATSNDSSRFSSKSSGRHEDADAFVAPLHLPRVLVGLQPPAGASGDGFSLLSIPRHLGTGHSRTI